MELLSVAQKYKMDVVLTHIRNHIARQQPPLIRKETAFCVYALAQKYGLRAEALQAARCTLTFSTMTIQDLAEEDNLGLMSGAFLHELWKYYERVRSNLITDIEEFMKPSQDLKLLNLLEDSKCESKADFDFDVPGWVGSWISDEKIASAPASFDFTSFHLGFLEHCQGLDSKYGKGCEPCSKISQVDRCAFWEALMAVVQGSITKVRFTHVAASPDRPDRSVQAESDFAIGVEGVGSERSIRAREVPSLPKYSDMPSADIILQSSDLVNFRVHRLVLVTSSSFFRVMFTLPQPSNAPADGLPVVHVPEAAEVLNSLLSILYPVPPEMPHSIDNILALLAAAEKYDMGAVQSSIRAEISRKKLLSPTDSAGVFHMYAVASSKKLIPEMEAAARLSLDYPLTFESVGEALRLLDGWALRGLADFRLRCVRNLVKRMESFPDDCEKGHSKFWADCPSFESRDDHFLHLPSWLDEFLVVDCQTGFTENIPSSMEFGDEFSKALQDHIEEKGCDFCSKVYILKGKEYCAKIEGILELARKVPIRILRDVPGSVPGV
jgi:hypothetical protein